MDVHIHVCVMCQLFKNSLIQKKTNNLSSRLVSLLADFFPPWNIFSYCCQQPKLEYECVFTKCTLYFTLQKQFFVIVNRTQSRSVKSEHISVCGVFGELNYPLIGSWISYLDETCHRHCQPWSESSSFLGFIQFFPVLVQFWLINECVLAKVIWDYT